MIVFLISVPVLYFTFTLITMWVHQNENALLRVVSNNRIQCTLIGFGGGVLFIKREVGDF